MSVLAAESFRAQNGQVDVSVEGPGTGDGFDRFCEGDADVTGASRPIEAEELAACAEAGIEVVELPLARDGITLITAPGNPVACLSFPDLYALLGPEATTGRWDGAEPLAAALGSHTDLPDRRLVVTGPGEESGTYDSFIEQVLDPIAEERAAAGHLAEAAVGTARPDYAASANDNTITEGVAADDGGLGWVSFAYAELSEDVREVPVAAEAGGPCVAPSRGSIQDGTYPIARTLYVYVNAERAAAAPAVAAFVDFYLAGLDDFVRLASYVPLADPAATVARWGERVAGPAAAP
jgi:phosphate transport system substrate-binding protein